MRCPDCREGIMKKCRAKMKNGEIATVLFCGEVWDAWVDEVCLETEIDFNDVLEVVESYGEVDSDHSRDSIIPSEIYRGWDKKECTDIWLLLLAEHSTKPNRIGTQADVTKRSLVFCA